MTTLRTIMLFVAGMLLSAQKGNAQAYKPGSRVEAEWSGGWHKAIVVSKNADVYKVAFDDLKDEHTHKKLQSSLAAENIRPCTNCGTADGKKPIPSRAPLKLPLLQKATGSALNEVVAKTIIQATWEDPAQYVDGSVKIINADVTIVEIGKPAKLDSMFVANETLSSEMPVYPVTVAVKVRRYKSDRMVCSDGEYLYRLTVNKMGNWVALYVATRAETPLETILF